MGSIREKCRAKEVEVIRREDTKVEEEMDRWDVRITRVS
jgi:hypothetical protein